MRKIALHVGADAACHHLALSALDDVRLLDHAGQRHLQPGHRALAVDDISLRISRIWRPIRIFVRAMFISITVAVIYTFLSVLLTSMAGWALARYRFAGTLRRHSHHSRHDHLALSPSS